MRESKPKKLSPYFTHGERMDQAEAEYARWHARTLEAPSAVERHFLEATQAPKHIEAREKNPRRAGGAA